MDGIIVVVFSVFSLGVGFGMGLAGAKVYVSKKVDKQGQYGFRQNNSEYRVRKASTGS